MNWNPFKKKTLRYTVPHHGVWEQGYLCHCGEKLWSHSNGVCPKCGCRFSTAGEPKIVIREEWDAAYEVGWSYHRWDGNRNVRWVKWTECTHGGEGRDG